MNKYQYEKILQGNYGESAGWEDLASWDCNSQGTASAIDRKDMKDDLKAYRLNSPQGSYRIIFRKTKV